MTNGPHAAYAGRSKRTAAVSAAESLLRFAREMNALRPPDHREHIAQAVAVTEENFRPSPESRLPPAGADFLLDRVQELAAACDASRTGYEQACLRLERELALA